MGIRRSVFKKHTFSQLILMILQSDLVIFGSLWGHFGVSLGSLLAYEGDFETLWGYFGVTSGSCAGLMGPKSGKFEKVLVFKRFLSAQWRGGPERGIPREGFWDPFEATLGQFLKVFISRCDFGINVELLWVYEGLFSRNTHSPN